MLIPRRPVVVRRLFGEQLFAVHIACASSLGYGLVIYSATLPPNPLYALIGPLAALWMFWAGWQLLQKPQPKCPFGAVAGLLLGSSLGTVLTHWLTGVDVSIALQATGIAGGVASVIGMRFGARAASIAALLGGLCAAGGASLLPTMLETSSWLAWVVNIGGSAWVTWWLGYGIAKVCLLENPVVLGNVWGRLEKEGKGSEKQKKAEQTSANLEPLPSSLVTLASSSMSSVFPDPTDSLEDETCSPYFGKTQLKKIHLDVARLMIQDFSIKEMAQALHRSEPAISQRIAKLKQHFGVESRTELIIKIVESRILEQVG